MREPREQAIKQHVDTETRNIFKREADDESKKDDSDPKKGVKRAGKPKKNAKSTTPAPGKDSSSTSSPTSSSTTHSPTSGKPTTGKPHQKAKKGSTTSTTTKKPGDGALSTTTTTKKPGGADKTTKKPGDEDEDSAVATKKARKGHLIDPFEKLDQLQHEERDALDMALAGLKSWMRLLEKSDRTYNRMRAGKFLNFVQKLINMPQIRREGKQLVDEFRESEYEKDEGDDASLIMSGFGSIL